MPGLTSRECELKESIILINIAKYRKKELQGIISAIISQQFQNEPLTQSYAMNTSDKNTTALETLSFVAIVSCVLSAVWFLATNFLA